MFETIYELSYHFTIYMKSKQVIIHFLRSFPYKYMKICKCMLNVGNISINRHDTQLLDRTKHPDWLAFSAWCLLRHRRISLDTLGPLIRRLCYYALCSQDFSDIYSAVDRGSFNSIDEFAHDMVAVSHEEKGGDNYGAIKDVGKPLMPFGKAVTKTRGWLMEQIPKCLRFHIPGLTLGLRPANERRRYKVTPSLIGWAQT